jgi:LCP family protein required for cell wall assembly
MFMVICAISAAGALHYAYRKAGQVNRYEFGATLAEPAAAAAGSPENFLIVGTDDATGLAPDDPVLIGRPPGLRSDVIMVVRVDPATEHASILSLPRDLYVPIAGTKGSDRINSAIAGGPQRLVETITKDLGIPVNHYVELNFLGFRDIVAAIGGVPVYFAEPVRDRKTGLAVDEPGCVTLDPVQALAYARSRAYEFFEDGRWHVDGGCCAARSPGAPATRRCSPA